MSLSICPSSIAAIFGKAIVRSGTVELKAQHKTEVAGSVMLRMGTSKSTVKKRSRFPIIRAVEPAIYHTILDLFESQCIQLADEAGYLFPESAVPSLYYFWPEVGQEGLLSETALWKTEKNRQRSHGSQN